jgi:DNA-binding transcriptional LysR family regulator
MSIASRTLGEIRYIICASTIYLDESGTPSTPEDLVRHNCLVHHTRTPDSTWHLLSESGVRSVKVSGSLSANSDTTIRAGVRNGLGIAILPEFCIAPELERGEVVELLPDFTIPKREITALIPHARQVPHKTRVTLDFLSSRLRR